MHSGSNLGVRMSRSQDKRLKAQGTTPCPKCGQPIKTFSVAVAENRKADYGLCTECSLQFMVEDEYGT